MAKLPDFQVLGEPSSFESGRIGRGIDTSAVPKAIEGFGASVVAVGEVLDKMATQAAYVEAVKIEGELAIKRADLKATFENDAEPVTVPARFLKAYDAQTAEHLAGVQNSRTKMLLERLTAQGRGAVYTSIVGVAAKKQNEQAVGTILREGSDFAKNLSVATDPAVESELIQKHNNTYEAAVRGGTMSGHVAYMTKSKDMAEAITLTTMTNPARAASMLAGFRPSMDAGHVIVVESAMKVANNNLGGLADATQIYRGVPSTPSRINNTPGSAVAPRLEHLESRGRADLVNDEGYSGRYQIGAPLASDAGIYTPGSGETVREGWSGNKWSGTFEIPGFPNVKTHADFLKNPEAQQAAYFLAQKKNDETAQSLGLYGAVGKTINGVHVTREGVLAGMWLGGSKGVHRWISSNGQDDPRDSNGTPVSRWVALGQGAQTKARGGRDAVDDTPWNAELENPSAAGPPPFVRASRADMMREAMARNPDNPARLQATLTALNHMFQAEDSDRIERQRADQQQQHAIKVASDEAETRVIADVEQVGQNPTITAQQIGDPKGPYAALTPDARYKMIGFIDRKTKPDPMAAISNSTSIGLLADMRRPAGDPEKITTNGPIYDAYLAGKLNRADFEFLQGQFKNQTTDEGARIGDEVKKLIAAVKPLIDKSNPIAGRLDQTGMMQTMLYERMVQASVDRMRKEGKDPYILFDPANPAWLGSPAILSRFQTTMTESIETITKSVKPRVGDRPTPAELVHPIVPSDARPPLNSDRYWRQ